MGRKKKFTELRKSRFIELLEQGNTIASICEGLGIDSSTYRKERRADPEFARQVDSVKDVRVEFVADSLYQSALAGNVTAQIFFLCNRDPGNWQSVNKLIAENKGRFDVVFDFSHLSDEQLKSIGKLIVADAPAPGNDEQR